MSTKLFLSSVSNVGCSMYMLFMLWLSLCFPSVLADVDDDEFLSGPGLGAAFPVTPPVPVLPQNDEIPSDEKQKQTGYICNLCIHLDHEFAEAYNTKGKLKASIFRMIEHASWIFRSTDWNNDGKPDNIGFKAKKMSLGWMPYRHESKEHYDTPQAAINLLKIFARLNFSTCCLGVGFTNRPFLNGLDGISFAASDKILGGICDHRNPREEFMISMNIILMSGRAQDGTQLTMFHMTKALIHELGHAFGARLHDDEYKAPGCWGFKPGEYNDKSPNLPVGGRYIMWAKDAVNPAKLLVHNVRFSSCSKSAITLVLDTRKERRKCFEPDFNPFCGNGVIEGEEACDCGSVLDCSRQKCCGSRTSGKPCKILDTKACPPNVFSKHYGESEARYSASYELSPTYFNLITFFIALILL